MSKTFIESIIPFITSMRKGISEEGGVVYPEGTPFEDEQSYEYAYYNKDLPIEYINSVLESLDYKPDGDMFYTQLLIGTKDESTWGEIEVLKADKSAIGGQSGEYLYIIMANDPGCAMDEWVYSSEDVDFGEAQVSAGWHTQIEGRIQLDHQPTKRFDQWDKVKTIFSSTEF